MAPARHSLQGNPSSGLDDPYPREWTNFRYRILSIDAPGTPSSTLSFQRHSLNTALLVRRDAPLVAEHIPHPPPPYTPTIALHAATLAPNVPDPSLNPNNPDWSASQPAPILPAAIAVPHSSPGILIAAIVISAVVAISAAVATAILLKKRHVRFHIPIPAFLQRHSLRHKIKSTKHWKVLKLTPSVTENEMAEMQRNSDLLKRTTSLFQYVHITHDDEEDQPISPAGPRTEDPALDIFPESSTPSGCLSPVRRHTSPALPSEYGPPSSLTEARSVLRPTSLPPLASEASILIQQQKLAELAQIQRMKIIEDDSSSPVVAADENPESLRGLGIVNEDAEVDIGSTVLAALQHYKLFLGKSLPDVPVSAVFQVNDKGKVIRTSPTASSSDPDSFASTDSGTFFADSEEDVVEIGMARTQSVEIQKGVLVSLSSSAMDIPQLTISTPSTIASRRVYSSPQLSYPSSLSHEYLRPYSPTPLEALSSSDALNQTIEHFPSPPPMLSPILTSSITLSAEIESSLEERVFAYRDRGSWAKGNYKIATPGRVRALTEALGFRKSVSYQPQKSWPWPAVREAEEV